LAEIDSRFNVITGAVDDRTEEERNPMSSRYIHKSRYSPVYSYLSENVYVQDFHNDYPKFPINEEYYKILKEAGVPERLTMHFCNLLVRDPLVVFSKKIYIEDPNDKSHFENFNSTNWNSLRFKPPRIEDGDTCFKVEVRPCDLQITPFENLSIIHLIIIISRIIINYDSNFIIPISKVDENMERAGKINCIEEQKFWWRVNGIHKNKKNDVSKFAWLAPHEEVDQNYLDKEADAKNVKELSIKEILLGSIEHDYPGVLSLCYEYLSEFFQENNEEKEKILKSFKHTELKAKGEVWTDAKYIRNFVLNHPKYAKDSIVTDVILH
jgi:glutamate--cysteine ligase catalytic subunit